LDPHNTRTDNLAEHFLYALPFPSTYHLSIDISLDVFNPSFPASQTTIGDVIRKLRIERGLFQKQLARGIGVDEVTIVNWEKSRTRPGRRHMERLSEYFSQNLNELAKGGSQT